MLPAVTITTPGGLSSAATAAPSVAAVPCHFTSEVGCLVNADIFLKEAGVTPRPHRKRCCKVKAVSPHARINRRNICERQQSQHVHDSLLPVSSSSCGGSSSSSAASAASDEDDWHLTDMIHKLTNLYNVLLRPPPNKGGGGSGRQRVTPEWAELDSSQPLDTYLSSCLQRYHQQMWCSDECFVLALVYVDRLLRRQEGLEISPFNVRNILFGALVTAAKYYDEVYYTNQYYANVGGMDVDELNRVERLFLSMVDFELHVDLDTFQRYSRMIEVFASPRSASQ